MNYREVTLSLNDKLVGKIVNLIDNKIEGKRRCVSRAVNYL